MEDYLLIDNSTKNQYEFHVGNLIPRIEYIKSVNGEIYLTHTEVPFGLSGRGIGSQLVRKALEDVENQDLRLIPLCPFIASYIRKNPKWKSIVMRGINVG